MKRKYGMAAACLAVVLLNGCGKFFIKQTTTSSTGTTLNGSNSAVGDILYFMNGNAQTVSGYSVNTAGVLTPVANSPYSQGVPLTAMAITPGNTFLYVAYAEGILGYAINDNGSLSILNSGKYLVQQTDPVAMAVDATGNFLLAASEDLTTTTPEIGFYQINGSTGALTSVNNYPLVLAKSGNGSTATDPGNFPIQLYIAPNNAFVYLTLGNGGTEVLSLSASNSTLTDSGSINLASNGIAQTGVIANSSSTFLYVTETGSGVRAFKLLSTGLTGTELTGSPYTTAAGPSALSFDSSGGYLYVASRAVTSTNGGTIDAFSVSANGQLASLASFASGGFPESMTLDQSQNYLAVADQAGGPNLNIYGFGTTNTQGELVPVANSAVTGNNSGTTLVVGTQVVPSS